MNKLELKSIIACNQSDRFLKRWAKNLVDRKFWLKFGIALGLALILVPVGRVMEAVSWTKIVSLNASELSFATIQMMGLGETINYVYMGSTPKPYSGPSDIWLYFAGGLILLGFSWWYLQGA